MIYLELFWTFFKIGLFTIGGGQAMIPMIMTNVVNKGWLGENQLLDFIAISLVAPRVMLCAAHQALTVLRLLDGRTEI